MSRNAHIYLIFLIIYHCFNFFLVFKDCFNKHGYNFDDVNKNAILGLLEIRYFEIKVIIS